MKLRDFFLILPQDLGKEDSAKLDQSFPSVREFEKRIKQSTPWLARDNPETHYSLPSKPDSFTLKDKPPLF